MKNPVKHLIWRTGKGEDIQIRHMETSHIENCLRLMDWGYPWRRRFYDNLTGELARRAAQHQHIYGRPT